MSNTSGSLSTASRLPVRRGVRPTTTSNNPHSQLDQFPDALLNAALVERFAALENVDLGPSGRAPYGTVGLHVHADAAQGVQDAFMLGHEFAHLHPAPDGSLHLTLPEPLRTEAIAARWAEPHPLAGFPSVSPHIVMVYAPRDLSELDTVMTLVNAARRYALGHDTI